MVCSWPSMDYTWSVNSKWASSSALTPHGIYWPHINHFRSTTNQVTDNSIQYTTCIKYIQINQLHIWFSFSLLEFYIYLFIDLNTLLLYTVLIYMYYMYGNGAQVLKLKLPSSLLSIYCKPVFNPVICVSLYMYLYTLLSLSLVWYVVL